MRISRQSEEAGLSGKKLSRVEKLDEVIEGLNPLLNLEGKGSVKVVKSSQNIVIDVQKATGVDGFEDETFDIVENGVVSKKVFLTKAVFE